MKTLVVPDVHEDINALERVERLFDNADRIVMFGDWMDTFFDHHVLETIAFMLKYMHDKRFTWLWGNHDTGYTFTHPWFRCSGWRQETQDAWVDNVPTEFLREWRIWTEAEGFLLSHAGFCPDTYHLCHETIHDEALRAAWTGKFHDMWLPGEESGGFIGAAGGPTWLRWSRLAPVGKPQIVGHTKDSHVRAWEGDYCIDTGLRHVMMLEEGKATIIRNGDY